MNNHTAVHHHDDDGHNHEGEESWKSYLPVFFSLLLLLLGIYLDYIDFFSTQTAFYRIGLYTIAYLLVGLPVLKNAFIGLKSGDIFNEFFLMSIATLGAFYIQEYPEGVAVMLFYAIGELFQTVAVNRAKRSIAALLDIRPQSATVFRKNEWKEIEPKDIKIGENIRIKVGEKVPVDGVILSEAGASFETAALTGESRPRSFQKGEAVLSGMLNVDKVVEIQAQKRFEDSALARILNLVQEASAKKAPTELFIRKFARIYTPIVCALALGLLIVPYFIVPNYQFNEWLYRALILLVISCPCALVISIPLGYFGGIGAASKNGVLFKGSNYLDLITKLNTLIVDKTGTLTEGVFAVQQFELSHGFDAQEVLQNVVNLERQSTHPVAKAVVKYGASATPLHVEKVEEIAGHGLAGWINGVQVLAGNAKLMDKFGVIFDAEIREIPESTVLVAIEGRFAAYFVIADRIKPNVALHLQTLKQVGITKVIMLSGDKNSITQKVASNLNIAEAYGDLLPEDKVLYLKKAKQDKNAVIAFVGDGINDAPSLALADIGIAMGGMGSDVAIETADIILQTDEIEKLLTAIKVGKATQKVIYQNVGLAFGVKALVLILGAGGIATMWEAVFADVGVALLAILNAVRIQRMRF